MELTFERTQPKKWTLRLNPCKHRLYTVRFGSFCSCLKQKKIRRYFRTQRKENTCVLQPLFKNRMWFRFLILWCSLLIHKKTKKTKKNPTTRNSHFAHNSESENIWDCSSCRVCVCEMWLSHDAISTSPANSLPVYILHQGSSMFGARCSHPVVYCSEKEFCFVFYWNSTLTGFVRQLWHLWGILLPRFVRKSMQVVRKNTRYPADAHVDSKGSDHLRVTWNRRAAH